jgi:large-conductance mechanosensitive channel
MNPEQERATKKWHFDKNVSISHIISTILIAVSVFAWAMDVNRRIDKNTTAVAFVSAQQSENKEKVERLRMEIKNDLRDINLKLDRLIQTQINH